MGKSATGNIFLYWVNIGARYDRLKNDEQKQPVSVNLGVQSIIYSILGTILLSLFTFSIAYLVKTPTDSLGEILKVVVIVLCSILALLSIFYGILNGLMCAVYQKRLNKLPIGSIALGINIASMFIVTLVTVLFFVLLWLLI